MGKKKGKKGGGDSGGGDGQSGSQQQQQPKQKGPQQQEGRQGPPHQPQEPPGQQFRPRGPPGQQFRPRGPPGQFFRPQGPPGQQFRPRGPPGQQFRPRGPPGYPQGPVDTPQGPPPLQEPDQTEINTSPPQESHPKIVKPKGEKRDAGAQRQDVPGSRSDTSSSASSSHSPSPAPSGSGGQSVTAISKKFEDISVSSAIMPMMPKRKQVRGPVGTIGRPIKVETNHLGLNIKDLNMKVYHYDVDIQPDKPYRLYRQVVDEFQRRKYQDNHFAFDGRKNIFTNIRMDEESVDEFTIFDEEKSADHKGIPYRIVVKYAREFRLSIIKDYLNSGTSLNPPQYAIQALDVTLRHPASHSRSFVSVGRSFFSPPRDRIVSLGDGLTLWYGFYQSAILGWKPYLNVDVAHKGFPDPVNCIEAICNLNNLHISQLNTPLDRNSYANFKSYIKNLKVVYEIPDQRNSKRTYKISDLALPPNENKFKDDNNVVLTVAEYFLRKKNYRLQYPFMPCLQAGQKTEKKNCCLPAELCTIMQGQVLNKKMNERQTASMVKAAARPADERKQRILNSVRNVRYNSDPCIRQFGLTVNEEFEKVDARIMPAPSVEYDKKIQVRDGVWRAGKFLSAEPLNNWAIVNLDGRTRQDSLRGIFIQFSNIGKDLGITVHEPMLKDINARKPEDARKALRRVFEELKEKTCKLVVVVIPPFGEFYSLVKQEAELFVGILTQCLKSKTVAKLNGSTVANILLKVNAKLNGTNHKLERVDMFKFLNRPAMIVGADVTHPAPDSNIPSVAAVTASFDFQAFKYNVEWRIQESRLEIIQDLESIMKNHLLHFYKITKHKPEKILFYRDGVSEGQFRQVLDAELNSIRRACAQLEPNYKPAVTFLVVQKRHHTRFFPTQQKDASKNFNVPAGTIVDTQITHPTEMDFFLVSHASIQGTSRPTKYHLLWDESDMSPDELEVTTYYLCHMFTRCTRSISYPAPTYYAHLAAFRIRAYCESNNLTLDSLKNNTNMLHIQKLVKTTNPMFYV